MKLPITIIRANSRLKVNQLIEFMQQNVPEQTVQTQWTNQTKQTKRTKPIYQTQ